MEKGQWKIEERDRGIEIKERWWERKKKREWQKERKRERETERDRERVTNKSRKKNETVDMRNKEKQSCTKQ